VSGFVGHEIRTKFGVIRVLLDDARIAALSCAPPNGGIADLWIHLNPSLLTRLARIPRRSRQFTTGVGLRSL
jgi:hypothetical protein